MKLAHFIIVFLIGLILISIISCSTRPRSILDKEKMIEILEDLYLADAILKNRYNDFSKDEDKKSLIEGVLKKHNITRAELDSSLVWYINNTNDNSTLYSQIQDSVSERLQRRKASFDKGLADIYNFQLSGFSVELPSLFQLNDKQTIFSFKIDSNEINSFETEKFKFSFHTSGVDTTKHRVESKLYFRYKDTVVVEKQDIYKDNYYEFLKPSLGDSCLLREISGYVRLRPVSGQMRASVWLTEIRNKMDSIPTDSTTLKLDENELISSEGVY